MRDKAWSYYRKFLTWDAQRQHHELTQRSPEFWQEMGAQKALEVFHAASERVPAYRKFLKEHDINPRLVRTMTDFAQIPPMDKKNYLRRYPLAELCWDGDLTKLNVISVSSGSTGEPFYWPRDAWQEAEVDFWYELTYRDLFQMERKSTLVVVAFAMGMYVAGPFTFASTLRIAQKGYPITVTSASNNIEVALKAIKNLWNQFDQIAIGGYPPLVRDMIERGKEADIAWSKKPIKLFFGGEGFSEGWRDYVHEQIGSRDPLHTTINMYGTADSALLGIESPVSITLRRLMADAPELRRSLVASERLPSVLSYNPLLKYFEVADDHGLLFTSSSGVPLIRYHIGDVGGLLPYNQVENVLTDAKQALPPAPWQLPLVYLFGRHDFTVHIYGANVYPENIKEALEDSRIHRQLSGKFIITTENRADMSQYLNLRLELAAGVKTADCDVSQLRQVITEVVRQRNSEYDNAYEANGAKVEPKISLEAYGHPDFKIDIKHRWVKQEPA